MAADVLASAGCKVSLFEKRKAPSWKLYVAGSSGLNISHALPLDRFAAHYTGPAAFWQKCLEAFPPEEWLRFIEKELEIGTFLGTSQRYFVETMHAAKLVRQWRRRLEHLGVQFHLDRTCRDFCSDEAGRWRLLFDEKEEAEKEKEKETSTDAAESFDGLCLALGGASYEKELPHWPQMLEAKGLKLEAFEPSNTGYELDWPAAFVKEADGLPLKNIVLSSAKGQRRGDMVITSYGLEGTPIYFVGETGPAWLDLKPDLSLDALRSKMEGSRKKENFAPLRSAQKNLSLHPAARALLFHLAPEEMLSDREALVRGIKKFPLELLRPRPLSESISSRGGLSFEALDQNLMVKTLPGVFAAGEMIAWDAPTGGFLIQACISQGHWAAAQLLKYLSY